MSYTTTRRPHEENIPQRIEGYAPPFSIDMILNEAERILLTASELQKMITTFFWNYRNRGLPCFYILSCVRGV